MKEEFGGTRPPARAFGGIRPPAPGLRRDTGRNTDYASTGRTARGRDSSAREERVVHGDDVFRRDIGHDVVDLLEDKAAAWIQDLHLFANVVRDLGGVAWGRMWRVSQPPPQNVRSLPKSLLSD